MQFDSMDRADAREFAAPELVTDELERQDDRLRLQKALGQLPVKHRQALISHFVDGLSVREIASREGVPIGTVLSRIFTGKHLLRLAWEYPLTGPPADAMARGAPAPGPQGRQSPPAAEPARYQQPFTESPEPVTGDR